MTDHNNPNLPALPDAFGTQQECEAGGQVSREVGTQYKTELIPIIGSMIGSRADIEVEPDPMDSTESLIKLERDHEAADFIHNWYTQPDLPPVERALGPLGTARPAVDRINNQFLMRKILPCLLDENMEQGLEKFRQITPNTVDEEMVLLTNDDEFVELYQDLSRHLQESTEVMAKNVAGNMQDIAKADIYQFSVRGKRGLERMRDIGMPIYIDPKKAHLVRQAYESAGDGILPVTELVKNERVFDVNDFMDSKVSLAIHDAMDHFWTFDMLEKAGILDRYSNMFDSIGNPETTDIYKREGEIVASIAFGVRYYHTMPSAFGPIFRTSMIEKHMEELLKRGEIEQRHMPAYVQLKSMRQGSIEWQSLGFAFSNYIVELDEQRRKFGRIKQRDRRTNKPLGELDEFSADFMSFFIDTHKELMSPKNKHRDDLLRFHIMLEEYLIQYAQGKVPEDEPLTVKPQELKNIDFTTTTLPPQRIQWMRTNHGFSATRDNII